MSASYHLLLVEDDKASLIALPELLGQRLPRLALDACETPQAALNRLRQIAYDAIISDLRMPGMDGLALLQEAKKLQPLTPFILVTGLSDSTLAARALADGAHHFVQKPIDREQFVHVVRQALEVSVLRRYAQAQEEVLTQVTRRFAHLDENWHHVLETEPPLSQSPALQQLIEQVSQIMRSVAAELAEAYHRRTQIHGRLQELTRERAQPTEEIQLQEWFKQQEWLLRRKKL